MNQPEAPELGSVAASRVSALLTTMAVLKANYNEGLDYLANFEPFVADTLKRWPENEPVRPNILRERLAADFSIPSPPINTAQALRERAFSSGLLRRDSHRDFYPDPRKLDGIPDLRTDAENCLGHIRALNLSLREFAEDNHGITWSEAEADAALERFAEEFSVELATARRIGRVDQRGTDSDDEVLAVVHAFARNAFEDDPITMGFLEEMVQGSMLSNVLYFQALGSWSTTLPKLVAYLDTTVVLRVLGLAPDPQVEAAKEMMALFGDFQVGARVFRHTVDEIVDVLEGIATGLRRAKDKRQDFRTLSRVNREVNDALIQRGWTATDVEEITADLERRLLKVGIQPVDAPKFPTHPDYSEQRLDEMLEQGIPYRWAGPKVKDIRSLTATHELRDGKRCNNLSKTPAVFVTANERLARIGHRFFKSEHLAGAVPHCTTDVSLTTQLWVRRPEAHPDVPRKFLIAESYAALSPDAELWERWLTQIERQRTAGAIDDQQVKLLVYSMEAREPLFEVTKGDADAVDEGTPLEVLDRLRHRLRRPAELAAEGAQAETQEAVRERDEALAQLQDQGQTLDDLVQWKRQREEQDSTVGRRRKRLRRVFASAVSATCVVAAVALPLLGVVEGPFWISAGACGLALVASVSAAWGWSKDLPWVGRAFVAIGAVLALPLGLYGVLQDSKAESSSPASKPQENR